MKKFVVMLERATRGTDEIGDCDPMIEKWFLSEKKARDFYEEIDLVGEYKFICSGDKKDHYLEKSLASAEFEFNEENGEWIDKGEGLEFIETDTAGKHFDNEKRLFLVNTLGTREFWTVEKNEGVITLRSIENLESIYAENCDAVEDDSSWDEIELTDKQYENLFDGVKIIDERDFD